MADMKSKVKQLCKEKGVSMNTAESEIGLAKGYISKLGKSNPNMKTLQKIADYFGVTTEFLMSDADLDQSKNYYLNEETAKKAQEMFEDPDMRALFDMKRNMPPERFSAHVKFMKELYESGKRNND